jgi:hypothetical protein
VSNVFFQIFVPWATCSYFDGTMISNGSGVTLTFPRLTYGLKPVPFF